MEKGKLIITKNGGAKVKRTDGKETNIIPQYDYSDYIPTSGKNRIDCEYETNDKKQAIKVFIEGKELPRDTKAAAEKAERDQKREWNDKKNNAREEQRKKQELKAYNLLDAKLPMDTQELLSVASNNGRVIDNFALKLQKTANFPEDGKTAVIYRKDRKKGTLAYTANFGSVPFKSLNERQYQNAAGQFGTERQLQSFELSTATRLIIGIGGASVYEVGITLHHVYGIPYIPPSAIKGLTRSWMIQSQFNNDEGKALGDQHFCDLFGCPAEWKDENNASWPSYYEKNKKNENDPGERQGNIIFFDAFPTKPPKIEEDVMNVHYPDYYKEEAPPTDFQSPIPITFLTVAAGTPFQFMICVKENMESNDNYNKELLNKAGKLLTDALTQHGIGAKTAVGYGYFKTS
jgi:CRISPR-associated protein Cmr6